VSEQRARRVLLVDYAEVISLPQPKQAVVEMASLAGTDAVEFADAYWRHRPDYDRGLPACAYWSRVLGREVTERDELLDQLVSVDIGSWSTINEAVLALLADARRAGLRLSLLSNAPHEQADWIATQPAFSMFDALFFSARLGLAKPDPAIYHAVIDRLGVPASEVLFVDDRAENLDPAASVGLRTLHFTSVEALADRLGEWSSSAASDVPEGHR
jgi:putative hydrolase of the HAD superfamily